MLKSNFLLIVICLLMMTFVFVGCDEEENEQTKSSEPYWVKYCNSILIFETGKVYVADTIHQAITVNKYLARGEDPRWLVDEDEAFTVPSGTLVEVIDREWPYGHEVKICGDEHMGETGWVPTTCVGDKQAYQ